MKVIILDSGLCYSTSDRKFSVSVSVTAEISVQNTTEN